MSQRLRCSQGHSWSDAADEAGRCPTLFCPTCGLRTTQDHQPGPRYPARSFDPAPTPFESAAGEPLDITTVLQPCDIEEVPGYELLGVLGRGGMGIVFRARQLSLKRQVALKMILAGRHARVEERARLQCEAEAVAKLQHPNIVQIYEVGQHNGLLYCALEFVNAGSLAQFLGGHPQSPKMAAAFLYTIAQAMHYAHTRGIVHRDLKPANILLHLDECQLSPDRASTALFDDLARYVPKISDFGLAKHLGDDEGPSQPGTIIGTPSYMAPEQARGTIAEVGPQADVYALGAILYEMLTGQPPFQAGTATATAQQVLTETPPPPTTVQPKIPTDLETICLTCLHKDPSLRYHNAEALGEDLRRFLANEPILARHTGLPDRVGKWAAAALLAAALVALSLLSLLSLVQGDRATAELRDAMTELEARHQQSERNLHRALQAIDRLTHVVESPHKTTASTRQALWQETAAFYRELSHAQGDDPAGRPLVALAALRLGDVQRLIGEEHEAGASYQRAYHVLLPLTAECPEREDYQQLLAACRTRLRARGELSLAVDE